MDSGDSGGFLVILGNSGEYGDSCGFWWILWILGGNGCGGIMGDSVVFGGFWGILGDSDGFWGVLEILGDSGFLI